MPSLSFASVEAGVNCVLNSGADCGVDFEEMKRPEKRGLIGIFAP